MLLDLYYLDTYQLKIFDNSPESYNVRTIFLKLSELYSTL